MKRAITMLLVAAMSLSLGACSSRSNRYEKYDAIIDSLENGNYDNAIDLIENMAQQGSGEAAGDPATQSTEPMLTPEQLAWQTDAVGVWRRNAGDTGFAIKADGTCVMDDKDYNWTMGDATETSVRIDVLDGQEAVYQIYISVSEKYGYKTASLNKRIDEYSWESASGSYYRNEDYTAVEITSDNWQDYFEVKEIVKLGKNSFGEVDEFHVSTYFRLKDSCGEVNAALSSVAMEYSSVSTCQDITVDLENKTYAPTGRVYNTADVGRDIKLRSELDCNSEGYYGSSLASFCLEDADVDPTGTVWRPVDIQILRIEGTLYLVK